MRKSSRRKDRMSHVIRDVVSDAIANHVDDPRVTRFTSVTRVELTPDLHFADVYVSVMGTEAEGRTTMRGLDSARGMIQTRLARQLEIRQCPILRLHLDGGLKRAIQTYQEIQAVSRGAAGSEEVAELNTEDREPGPLAEVDPNSDDDSETEE